jgi:hypothetical protein
MISRPVGRPHVAVVKVLELRDGANFAFRPANPRFSASAPHVTPDGGPVFHCAQRRNRASTYHRFMMSLSRKQLTVAWCTTVIAAGAGAVALGAGITAGNAVLFLVACVVPPAIMLLVWRPPPSSVAQLLYDVNAGPRSGTR